MIYQTLPLAMDGEERSGKCFSSWGGSENKIFIHPNALRGEIKIMLSLITYRPRANSVPYCTEVLATNFAILHKFRAGLVVITSLPMRKVYRTLFECVN